MSAYAPTFVCPYCSKPRAPFDENGQGVLFPCTCKASRDAWEREHRAAVERRKRTTRRPK